MRLSGEELEGLGGLDGGGEVDGGGEDAGGVAGFDGAGGGLGEDAGEAGGGFPTDSFFFATTIFFAFISGADGEDVHGGGVGAYGCGVDPGLGLLDGVVVD